MDAIVCTGDIADGRGSLETSCRLLWQAGVHSVAGNHDRWLLQDRVRHVPDAHQRDTLSDESLQFLTHLPRQQVLESARGSVLLCHGIGDDDLGQVWPGTQSTSSRAHKGLDALLDGEQFRFLINGHIHFRVLIDFRNLVLLNAGTLKGERGGLSIVDFAGGSVAAFEVADTGSPRRVNEQPLDSANRRIWRDTQEFDGDWTPVVLYE